MVRNAAKKPEQGRPAGRPRTPVPPPANDNRPPRLAVALMIVGAAALAVGAGLWLLLR